MLTQLAVVNVSKMSVSLLQQLAVNYLSKTPDNIAPQGGPVGDTDTMMLFALASPFWKQAKQSHWLAINYLSETPHKLQNFT